MEPAPRAIRVQAALGHVLERLTKRETLKNTNRLLVEVIYKELRARGVYLTGSGARKTALECTRVLH